MNDYITLNSYELVDGRTMEDRITRDYHFRPMSTLVTGTIFSDRDGELFEILSGPGNAPNPIEEDGTVWVRYGSAPYRGGAWEGPHDANLRVRVHQYLGEFEVTR